MRKFLIDTDGGSDDAVAIMLSLKNDGQVVAITTVCGNVPVEMATKNIFTVLRALDISGMPVYEGERQPSKRALVTAQNVHGADGLGEMNLPAPEITLQKESAVSAILKYARQYKNELEIIALGPATNIAKAILQDSEIMSAVKRIYTMGTGGRGAGNITPFAEFNVYVDAEAYDTMLSAGIPITVIGYDICLNQCALSVDELKRLSSSTSTLANFAYNCTAKLREFNVSEGREPLVELPDATAVAVALWNDIYSCERFVPAVNTDDSDHYGEVLFSQSPDDGEINLVTFFDIPKFKQRLFDAID